MMINSLGLVAAASAFLSIWLGHVAVRRIEFQAKILWVPITISLLFGLAVEFLSIWSNSLLIKTVLGIVGIIMIWSSVEFIRQEKRIKKGHAPANLNNPRHVRILNEFPSANIHDLLKREPLGKPVTQLEAIQLVNRKEG